MPKKAPAGEREEYRHAYDLLMTERRIPEAIDAFESFLAKYPDGRYADNAQFWLAEAHYAHNDLDGAIDEGVTLEWFLDADGDGFGAGEPVVACADRKSVV